MLVNTMERKNNIQMIKKAPIENSGKSASTYLKINTQNITIQKYKRNTKEKLLLRKDAI